MSVPVFTWEYDYGERITRKYDKTVIELAPGCRKVVSRDIAQTRADGTGSISSYGGQNVFTIRIGKANYDGDQKFRNILDFLQAREDDGLPFYFYNLIENKVPSTWTGDTASGPTADPAGNLCTNTTGRYLVRIFGEISWVLEQKALIGIDVTFEESFS